MATRILVIEDNPESLELMTYLLRAYGYATLSAADGGEGLKAVKNQVPDLVLCDLQMPAMDGYELARTFRQDPRLAQLPLVAVTASAMKVDREKVMAAGFSGYIIKPIDVKEFVGEVEAFLAPERRSSKKRANGASA